MALLTSSYKRLILSAAACMIATAAVNASPPAADSDQGQQTNDTQGRRERAEDQLKKQQRQRILGVIPNFNTSFVQDAAPLSARQKFRLALRSAVDPFAFFAAGLDAGLEQLRNGFPGYGQGMQGYGKRFGAAYTDSFSGNMFGGAVFPSLLHQDPRYFRRGSGTIGSRLFYAISTTVKARTTTGVGGRTIRMCSATWLPVDLRIPITPRRTEEPRLRLKGR